MSYRGRLTRWEKFQMAGMEFVGGFFFLVTLGLVIFLIISSICVLVQLLWSI